MAQRVNIQLGIQADASQARSQIQQLQKDLSALTQVKFQDGSLIPGLDPKSLGEANVQITQLKNALNSAFNAKTGKLDLGQFQASLQKSNLDINTLKATFQSLGPAGTTAFADLAKAVASAEAPVLRVGDGIRKFMTTFANSARYMVATRALNTFVGSIQNALNYAQDLNKSLNNIAIVTGASTDKMAEFAAQANKAAQRLSVTTTGYTDAALIYYQQGLNDQEVAARTEATMKMSNVTGESAQEVSSYMTAIWNNFYDGSESIESFTDKITALGAATASSSAEIAGGLQQFAAVANTVGLSYDYAATALATIVAQTRQSESTVGNGLRTLFSRMQGLKLDGETEDGVTLNKYSQALADVGVNALDASGELRNMDDILSDLGAKWETLSKAQQVALAQTVGGVRQYTTLVALMDNWGKFQENLTVAQGAEGTLQRQQEIYERSWEASRKRVQAAAQSIYQDIIDDDFFISLNDLFAGFLKTIDQVIKGLGGVKGVLSAVSAIVFTLFNNQIADKVERFTISLNNLYHPENIDKLKQEYLGAFKDFVGNTGDEALDKMTSSYATNALNSELELKSKILALSKNLSQENQEIANNIYKQVEAAQDLVIVESKALQETERQGSGSTTIGIQVENLKKALSNKQVRASFDAGFLDSLSSADINPASLREAKTFLKQNDTMNSFITSVDSMIDNVSTDNLKEVQQTLLGIQETTKDDIRVTEEFKKIWGEMANAKGPEEMRGKLEELGNYITESFGEQGTGIFKDKIATFIDGIPIEALTGRTKKVIEQLKNEFSQNIKQAQAVGAAEIEKVSGDVALKRFGDNVETFGQKVSNFARNASSIAMQINGIRGAITALNDKDIDPWERFTRVVSGFGIALGNPTLLNGIKDFSKTFKENYSMTPGQLEKERSSTFDELALLRGQSGFRVEEAKRSLMSKYLKGDNSISIEDLSKLEEAGFITEDGFKGDYKKINGIIGGNGNQKRLREFFTSKDTNFSELVKDIKEYRTLLNAEDTEEGAEKIKALEEKFKSLGISLDKVKAGSLGFKNVFSALIHSFSPATLAIVGTVAAVWALKKAYDAWYASSRQGRIEQNAKEIDTLNTSIQSLNSSIDNLQQKSDFLEGWVDSLTQVEEKLQGLNAHSTKYQNIVRETNSDLMNTLKQYNLWEKAQISINDKGLYVIDNVEELNEEIEKQKSSMLDTIDILTLRKNQLEEEQKILTQNGADLERIESASRRQDNTVDTGDISRQTYSQYSDKEAIRATKIIADTLEKEIGGFNGDLSLLSTDEWQKKIFKLADNSSEYGEALKAALEEAGLDSSIVDNLFNKEDSAELFTSLANIQDSLSNNFVEDAQMGASAMRMWGLNPDNLSAEQQADFYDKYVRPQYDKYQSLGRDEMTKLINQTGENEIFQKALADSSIADILGGSFTNGVSTSDWYTNGASKLTQTKQMQVMAEIIGGSFDGVTLKDAGGEKVDYNQELFEEKINEYIRSVIMGALARTELSDEELQGAYDKYSLENLEQGGPADNNSSTTAEEQVTSIMGLTGDDEATQQRLEQIEAQVDATTASFSEMNDAADLSHEVIKTLAWDAELSAEGLSELEKNGESWLKKVRNNSAGAEKALGKLTESMLKAVGMTDDLAEMGVNIDKSFSNYLKTPEGLENVEKAINGDTEALKELRNEASLLAFEENLEAADSPFSMYGLKDADGNEITSDDLINNFKNIQQQVQAALDADPLGISADMTVDPNFYSNLDAIVSSTATSIDEAQAILNSLNLSSADYDLLPEPVTEENPWSVDFSYEDNKHPENNGTIHGEGTMTQTATIWHPVPKGAAAAAASKTTGGRGNTSGKHSGYTTSQTTAKTFENGYQTVTGENGGNVYLNNDFLKNEKFWSNLDAEMKSGKYNTAHVVDYGDVFNAAKELGTGSGSGGGGGGGGGSGGKEREQKAYEDEIERYHYLLKTIDAVNKKYDELENAREKAYGTDEIEIMDKEIENLQEQIGLQKTYLDAISQDYESDRAAIAAYGAQFDENGNIINYEEIYRRQIDIVNSAAGDDEAADKAYEQFKKVLEQYEKTNELLQDTKLSYQELLDKAAELNLEKITVSVEYNVAISDRDRKYLEWLADNMGDSIDKTADKIANLSKQMETYVQDAQTYGEGINAILDQVGEAGLLEKIINQELTEEQFKELGLTTQQIEQIEDYKDKLMETQQAERELAKTAVEEVTTAFSDWNDEVSNSIDRITSLNDSLEKYRDIIGLLDEDIIGSTKALNDEIDAAERQNNLKAIEGQQRKYEQAQQNFERLNALYKDAQDKNNQVAIDALKDSVKEAEEAVIQAHQDMLEATSNALDALEKQWEASMERISKEFAKNMTGLNDISYFKDMYDRQKEMSDWYLDDYEKYYNLNKLVTQINKDLGDNSSLVVSSKLNGLLGKINGSLAEGAQISEATVGYYQKELELIEAQMALESARNAKSVVRMVRDNEGNMSYVYTADSDAIESAEENYQEKWYNLMQYTTEQQDELQEKMISSMEDFIDRAVEAAEKFGIGTEAFNRELGNIQQDFTDLFDYLAGEMDNADGMFSHLQNNWWKELEEGLQKTVALEPDFKTVFGKTILGQLLGTEDTEDWVELMNSGTNKALSEIYNNGQTYVQNQDAVLQAANSSLESVIDDTSVGVSENQEMANEEMQKLDETLTNGEKILGDAADSLKAFGDKWNTQMTAMTATTDALVNSLNNYFNALSKINDISSSSNPFDFSTMVPSFEQELEEMQDMPYSQLDLSEISSQLVSAPSMISDVSTSGLTALLSLVPSGELDQNVQINATFPNVVNHREIELALNNLILSASQYANRK